jgi:hypothetical protein
MGKLVESWKLTKMGSKIRNLHPDRVGAGAGQGEQGGHREERIEDKNSPDRVNQLGAADFTVRGNQGEPLDERGGSDNAIRWIFGISCWKCHGARTRTTTDRQDDKSGLDFLQEGFEACSEVNAAPTREGPHLQEGHIRDCQAVSEVAGFINGGSCLT